MRVISIPLEYPWIYVNSVIMSKLQSISCKENGVLALSMGDTKNKIPQRPIIQIFDHTLQQMYKFF